MLNRRLLIAGGGGSFTPPPMNYVGLINAANNSSYNYVIGPVSSSDGGATWTAGSGAVISPGAAYDSTYVKDPMLIWDGTQFVCYYHGYNGSNHQVARATASAYDGTWTKYAGNPILGVPNDGGWRSNGAIFPYVVYDAAATPKWKMWATGSQGLGPTYTIGFLDSSDGLTWTDRGRVLDVGTTGDPDANGLEMGGVLLVGSTWYIYYGGIPASNFYHACYATVALGSEGTAAAYTKHGVMTNWSGNVTVGGFAWRSNQPRHVFARGSTYVALWDGWNAAGHPEESCFVTTSNDPTLFPVPSALMIPLDDGSWHANSAENPTAIPAP